MNIKLYPTWLVGLCSTTFLFNLENQGKAYYHQWKEEALQVCFSNVFSYHEGWALLCLAQQPAVDTMGKNVKQLQGFAVIVPWITLSESLNLLLILVAGVRRRGCLLSLPTYVSFSCKKCWAGWEICSVISGALDRQNRITLILGFCLFHVL